MDAITLTRVVVTVLSMICFVVFVYFAYSKKNAATMDKVGGSIFDDEDDFDLPESSKVVTEVPHK